MTNTENAQQEVYRVSGVDCMDCALSMEKVLKKTKGVQQVKTSFFSSKLMITYDKQYVSDETIISTIKKMGYGIKKDYTVGVETSTFTILGMHCADCGTKIENNVAKMEGVNEAEINFMASTLKVNRYRKETRV